MDFLPQINGLNNNNNWKKPGQNKKTTSQQSSDIDINKIETLVNNENKRFKSKLINLQDFADEAQDKINILLEASEALNDISGNLNKVRDLALDAIDQRDDYEISNELKEKLENIDKIHSIQKIFERLKDSDDDNYSRIVDNFKDVAEIALKLAKIQDFKSNLNNNARVKDILTEINSTITSISSTEENLNEVKDNLIYSIKNLNVTLENMVSSYSKIRNLEIASKTVEITKHQILSEALKSINVQTADTTKTADKLVK